METEEDVLDPVGTGPSGGAAGSVAEAPRGEPIGHHLLGQRHEVLVGLGLLVPVLLEGRDVIEDDRLVVREPRDAVVLPVVTQTEVHPELRVVRLHLGDVEAHVLESHQVTLVGERADGSRLRSSGDVGRVASVDGDPQLVLEVGRTPERDRGSGHLVVDVDEALESVTLGAGRGTEERERGAHLLGFTVGGRCGLLTFRRSRLFTVRGGCRRVGPGGRRVGCVTVTATGGEDEREGRHERQQSRPSPHDFLLLALLGAGSPGVRPVRLRAGTESAFGHYE